MKKLINHPTNFASESLLGFVRANNSHIQLNDKPKFVYRKTLAQNKVALISGGGSGHEPAHIGFIGEGMLDAVCPGAIFSSPVPEQIVSAINKVGGEKGVLLIVKNYQGDIMNFDIASEMIKYPFEMVIVHDDVSGEQPNDARGIAGVLIIQKLLGAAAERGDNLADLATLANKVSSRMATHGLALETCTLPEIGTQTFTLYSDEIELGVGIHGEHGKSLCKITDVDTMVANLLPNIMIRLETNKTSKVLLFINGLGSTPLSELYCVYHAAEKQLSKLGITVIRSIVGNYVTALDSEGFSITLCSLDEELTSLWDDTVDTSVLRW